MKYIHNLSQDIKTYQGRPIPVSGIFSIPPNLYSEYSGDDGLIVDVANGNVGISSDGENIESSISDQINILKSIRVEEVVTQMEKNDKTLRTVCGEAVTDANGLARIAVKVPANGRKIAYGDAEFSIRHPGDHIKTVEFSDLERLIAWSIALQLDPEATQPIADEDVQQMGEIPISETESMAFPRYPVVDYYDERDLFSSQDAPETVGTVRGGISMTYQYGNTEVQPVGGYGNLAGLFYLIIEAQKAAGHCEAGIILTVSIDWGEPNR